MPLSTNAAPKGAKNPPMPPRPSASILLISPTNQILLLHRVQTSSSFPSAHVFPGGNCSAFHDGAIPDVQDEARHRDGKVYRWAGIRECFEESGILLARGKREDGLVQVDEEKREKARKQVHQGKRKFGDVLDEWGAVADLDGLIPFTRWITPTNIPKRFTTQMYLYFMPLPPSNSSMSSTTQGLPVTSEAVIPIPKPDGGIEHTAARFLPPASWISLARSGDIILFPPQFFLLHLISQYLSPSPNYSPTNTSTQPLSSETLQQQRNALLEFVKGGGWGDMCISPTMLARLKSDGRTILGLDKPGPELAGSGREGVKEFVVLVDFKKEGPRRVQVAIKKEIMAQLREEKEKL